MAGHSRPKDGVRSHAYVPAMQSPRWWVSRDGAQSSSQRHDGSGRSLLFVRHI